MTKNATIGTCIFRCFLKNELTLISVIKVKDVEHVFPSIKGPIATFDRHSRSRMRISLECHPGSRTQISINKFHATGIARSQTVTASRRMHSIINKRSLRSIVWGLSYCSVYFYVTLLAIKI